MENDYFLALMAHDSGHILKSAEEGDRPLDPVPAEKLQSRRAGMSMSGSRGNTRHPASFLTLIPPP